MSGPVPHSRLYLAPPLLAAAVWRSCSECLLTTTKQETERSKRKRRTAEGRQLTTPCAVMLPFHLSFSFQWLEKLCHGVNPEEERRGSGWRRMPWKRRTCLQHCMQCTQAAQGCSIGHWSTDRDTVHSGGQRRFVRTTAAGNPPHWHCKKVHRAWIQGMACGFFPPSRWRALIAEDGNKKKRNECLVILNRTGPKYSYRKL